MSYSYLNTVFPNFEYKMNPNLRLFNSLDNSNNETVSPAKETVSKVIEQEKQEFKFEPANNILLEKPIVKILSKETKEMVEEKIPDEKNNLNVYNKPLTIIENLKDVNKNDDDGIDNCMKSLNHMYTCKLCKEKFSNVMKMENKSLHNQDNYDELWEIITYIIFSVFILFLVDKLHK